MPVSPCERGVASVSVSAVGMAFVLVSDEGVAYVPVIHGEAQRSLCQSDPRDVAGPVKGGVVTVPVGPS